MKKNVKKAAKAAKKPLNAKLKALVASAVSVGYDVANGFQAGVALAKSIGSGNRSALIDAGLGYKAGYVVRYLEAESAFQRRWGNMSREQRFEEGAAIYAKPYPESSKPNRRSAIEHKACRAADVSWTGCKARAGIVSARKGSGGRKPRPSANPPKTPPVDLVKASPKLANRAAANDYFATAAAALLATVDKNARIVPPQLSTAVQDFKKAVSDFLSPAS